MPAAARTLPSGKKARLGEDGPRAAGGQVPEDDLARLAEQGPRAAGQGFAVGGEGDGGHLLRPWPLAARPNGRVAPGRAGSPGTPAAALPDLQQPSGPAVVGVGGTSAAPAHGGASRVPGRPSSIRSGGSGPRSPI